MKTTRSIAFVALFTALLCVLAPISIPIEPVALTLGTLAIYLIGALLDPVKAPISVLLYLILGLVGVPVFSKYNAGPSVLFGVTGGFLLGYIPGVFVQSLLTTWKKEKMWIYPLAMIAGTFFIYTFGVVWFLVYMNVINNTPTSLGTALMGCVVPFLLWDAAKIVVASLASFKLRKPLDKLLYVAERKKA